MSTDIEDLLRRTYADVAERTVVTAAGDASVVPLEGRGRAGWLRPALAAAAVLALVVSGLVALQRGRQQAGTVDESTFIHALPGYLPSQEPTGPFVALRSIRSDGVPETVDQLEYAGGGVELVIRTVATTAPLPTEPNTTLADGTAAWIDEGGTQLVWQPHEGFEIDVTLTGSDEQTLRAVADQLILVDDAAWTAATDHAGFLQKSYGADEPDPSVVASYELATQLPITVDIRGSIHLGYEIGFPNTGGYSGIPNATVDDCRATASFLVGDVGDPARVIVLTDTSRTVDVRVEGGAPRRVEVSVPIPGTQFVVETFEDDTEGASSLSWTCEEVAP